MNTSLFKPKRARLLRTLLLVFGLTLVFAATALGSDDRDRGRGRDRDARVIKKPRLDMYFIEGLRFGKVLGNASSAGKVVIDPATGLKETYGTFDLGGKYHRGEIEIRGIPGKRFHVTVPDKVILNARGGLRLRVTDITIYPSSEGVLGQNGKAVVYMGGTLTLKPSSRGSKSRGRMHVHVDYIE